MPQNAVLLISDIVDSTQLASSLGRATFASLFEAHDAIVARLAERHRGREINRSDGVLMRFQSVAGAIAFAVAYHDELATLGDALQVRIGIHSGPLELRNDAELRATHSGLKPGLAVPTTARIAGVAAGRQTLISHDARRELEQASFRIVSHGYWRLKGITDPIELFETGAATTIFAPPADTAKAYRVIQRGAQWLPRRDIAHSLPAERDHFIGRDDDLDAIAGLLEADERCITILGPGGVGKTRLAQRFGWRWLGDFEGGVWYCDLAQSTTCDGLVSAVAQGLGLPLDASSPIGQIASALTRRGACLVILDNFEQITRFARETLGTWLDAAAGARFIVTSRIVLGIAGETVHRLNSMESDEGADLFADRAWAANRSAVDASARGSDTDSLRKLFAQDAKTIASLVHLLDGNPLAIELAAARLRIMDMPTLLNRMRERFKVLARGTGRVARHATLRATLNWSWDLLEPHEKSALEQTSVFEGGFDLAAFEAIVLIDDVDAPAAMDVLQSLVEQSLIQQLTTTRFGLLISVQEYAAEHLAADAGTPTGSSSDAARLRHARYYAALDEAAATAERCVEIDNLVAAVRRSVALGDETTASLALVNCWAALKQCGPYRIGETLALSVREMKGLTAASEARVNFVAGSALQDMGDNVAAEACFQKGFDAATRGNAINEKTRLLLALGELELAEGRYATAAETLDQALAEAQAIDDALLRSRAWNALGTLAKSQGNFQIALTRYGEALTLAQQIDHQRWAGALLGNMGIALYGLDDRDGAKSHYVRALEIAVQFGDQRSIGNARSNLGLVLSDQGRYDDAIVELEAALKIARHLGHLRLECVVLWNGGITRAAQERIDDAIVYYEAARAVAIRLADREATAALDTELEKVRTVSSSV